MYQLYWFTQIYIYIYRLLQVAVNLWESEIGITGLVFLSGGGGILFLVDDGVSLEMTLGGFKAGLELLILLFSGVIATCPFTIYHFLVNVLGF